ncbi:myb transcription factor [Anaeramoeba flamelloides]|uniref:Myb transcription factor n=1 Tax=Anaeramoeba flamelloides TaxID=1746091 RepID=A0AAV7YM02_9EUKA|nr:myb transcription factor [Anaeramoeba flamelloides]
MITKNTQNFPTSNLKSNYDLRNRGQIVPIILESGKLKEKPMALITSKIDHLSQNENHFIPISKTNPTIAHVNSQLNTGKGTLRDHNTKTNKKRKDSKFDEKETNHKPVHRYSLRSKNPLPDHDYPLYSNPEFSTLGTQLKNFETKKPTLLKSKKHLFPSNKKNQKNNSQGGSKDKSINSNNQSDGLPLYYHEWSKEKQSSWHSFKSNPNRYYYRFNEKGEPNKRGRWTKEEHELFLKRCEEVGVGGDWGLFSRPIPGRVGYVCANRFRTLLKSDLEFRKKYGGNYFVIGGKIIHKNNYHKSKAFGLYDETPISTEKSLKKEKEKMKKNVNDSDQEKEHEKEFVNEKLFYGGIVENLNGERKKRLLRRSQKRKTIFQKKKEKMKEIFKENEIRKEKVEEKRTNNQDRPLKMGKSSSQIKINTMNKSYNNKIILKKSKKSLMKQQKKPYQRIQKKPNLQLKNRHKKNLRSRSNNIKKKKIKRKPSRKMTKKMKKKKKEKMKPRTIKRRRKRRRKRVKKEKTYFSSTDEEFILDLSSEEMDLSLLSGNYLKISLNNEPADYLYQSNGSEKSDDDEEQWDKRIYLSSSTTEYSDSSDSSDENKTFQIYKLPVDQECDWVIQNKKIIIEVENSDINSNSISDEDTDTDQELINEILNIDDLDFSLNKSINTQTNDIKHQKNIKIRKK